MRRRRGTTVNGALLGAVVQHYGEMTETTLKDRLRDHGISCGNWPFHDAVTEATDRGWVETSRGRFQGGAWTLRERGPQTRFRPAGIDAPWGREGTGGQR